MVLAGAVAGGGSPARAGTADVVPGAGTATHYDSVDGGNCSLPAAPADHLDVALSHVEYGIADACGGYLDVTGPNGTVRVLITNQCPECQVGHIDLSKTAFARIGPLEAGQIDVRYALVRNPPVAEPLAFRVKSGSSRWWMQIQPLDHGNPIASFELRTGSGWRSLVHTEDNFWMAENPGPGDGPFTVRLTDIYGQSAVVDGVRLAPDEIQRTGARLYGAGSTPAPAPAPPAAPAPTTAPPTTVAPSTVPTTAPPATVSPGTAPVAAPDGTEPVPLAAKLEVAPDGTNGPGTIAVVAAAIVTLGAAGIAARRRGRRRVQGLRATAP